MAFIDKTGKIVTPHFVKVWDFADGLAPVMIGTSSQSAYGLIDKIGFIDKAGNMVIPASYDGVWTHSPAFSEGLAPVQVGKYQDKKCGYIDQSGTLVIELPSNGTRPPAAPCDAHPFHEGLALVHMGRKSGFIDRTGRFVIPPQDFTAYDFSGGYARVSGGPPNNTWYGFIDKTGNQRIALSLDSWSFDSFHEGRASVGGFGGLGFIDETGKMVIPMQFDSVSPFSGGFALVTNNRKIGVIDRYGQIIVSLQFDG